MGHFYRSKRGHFHQAVCTRLGSCKNMKKIHELDMDCVSRLAEFQIIPTIFDYSFQFRKMENVSRQSHLAGFCHITFTTFYHYKNMKKKKSIMLEEDYYSSRIEFQTIQTTFNNFFSFFFNFNFSKRRMSRVNFISVNFTTPFLQ